MAARTTTSNSSVLSSLYNAIENEDIRTLKSLCSNNPEILNLATKNWPKNPLILACKLRKFGVIAEIGMWKPEFAIEKIQDGYSILHLACIRGDVEMVRALVRLSSQLCFLKDEYYSMIPLHMAIKYGHGDVIRELLLSCPESIEKLTTQKETVFHLAANKCQSDTFEVLLDEAMKLNQQYLLHQRDRQGNTALHIAVSNQLVRVVKLLLPELNSETGGHGFIIRVNAKNKKGEIALDLYNQIPNRAPEIGHLLHVAGGREGYLLEQKQSFPNLRNAKNDLLVVLAIFIGCFHHKHRLYRSAVMLVSLRMSTASCCGCNFHCLCAFYVLHYIVPKFFIRIGSHYVSSFYLMWILAVAFIFLGAQSILVWKCLSMQSYDFAKWLKVKLVSNVVFPSKKRLAPFKRSFWVQMVGITSTTAASNN
ncbi:hypothetical protein ACOSQ2_027307 [Xanthoceras sorbifolium]